MKNILRLSALIICVLSFQKSLSQENYLPAYILLENNDTVHGLIDYKNWGKNPDKILFKSNSGTKEIQYTPIDILEFGVADEIYFSAIVDADDNPREIDNLKSDPAIYLRKDTAFLQIIFRGDKNLYYYNDFIGKENFYITVNDEIHLLNYKKFVKEGYRKDAIVENKKYVGQLINYLNDCPSLITEIQESKYHIKGMTKLFESYYKNSSDEYSFNKELEKVKTKFGFVLGSSLTYVTTSDYPYLLEKDYSAPSHNLSAGVSLEVIFPRNRSKWSLYNELIYHSFNFAGEYQVYVHESDYTDIYTELGAKYIKLNNMFRYTSPIGQASLFLNGGTTFGFPTSYTNTKLDEKYWYGIETTDKRRAISWTGVIETGLVAGAGIRYKHFSIEVRSEIGTGLTKLVRASRYYAFLGYNF